MTTEPSPAGALPGPPDAVRHDPATPPRLGLAFDAAAFAAGLALGGNAAETAGRALIKNFRPLLRGRFFRAGVAPQEVDDLISEVLTAVVATIDQLRDLQKFDAWLGAIAVNVLNRHWIAKGRQRQLFQDAALSTEAEDDATTGLPNAWPDVADDSLSDPATVQCLKTQLERFRQHQPQRYLCIELLVIGYDLREVAERLGRSYGAARQFVSQCCSAVLPYLAPCLEASEMIGRRRGQAQRD